MRPIPCLSFNIKKLPFKRSEKGNFFIFKLNERHEGENDEANCCRSLRVCPNRQALICPYN